MNRCVLSLQTRLDALTEVDDCGQLTIRCSQDYFSLDCGITAFELCDYSPSDEPEARGRELDCEDPSQTQEVDCVQDPNSELGPVESAGPCLLNHELHSSLPELTTPTDSKNHNCLSQLPIMQCGMPNSNENAKRPLQGVSHSTEVSPTQPSLPKRAALFSDRGTTVEDSRCGLGKVSPLPGLQFQAELSRSTPSLMDPPDRSKFWLELDSVYPENVSQSYESLQVCPSLICTCVVEVEPKNIFISVTQLYPDFLFFTAVVTVTVIALRSVQSAKLAENVLFPRNKCEIIQIDFNKIPTEMLNYSGDSRVSVWRDIEDIIK